MKPRRLDGVPDTALERLRGRVCDRASWPRARDLVFTYEAGAEAPRSWEANLPEPDTMAWMRAIFATLAPGRALPALAPAAGHTYNWGRDFASVMAEGDGVLVSQHCAGDLEERRDGIAVNDVYHVLVRNEIAVLVESGTSHQRVARPQVVFELSATEEALNVATDAIMLATAPKLTFERQNDQPQRRRRGHRRGQLIEAFSDLIADREVNTAMRFAWIILGMFPAWFDFGPDKFGVETEARDLTLVLMSERFPRRRVSIGLSDSRNIFCKTTGEVEDRGLMSMHYQPSTDQYVNAQRTLLCALRWLHPEHDELDRATVAQIPNGRVFAPESGGGR